MSSSPPPTRTTPGDAEVPGPAEGPGAGDPADDGDGLVFRALADRTRRVLLDGLFDQDGQSLGQLCALVPGMSRHGVMKHLQLLEDAHLVTTLRQRRTKLHFLNAVPIAQVADRWISKYAAGVTAALTDLARHVETDRPGAGPTTPPPPEPPTPARRR